MGVAVEKLAWEMGLKHKRGCCHAATQKGFGSCSMCSEVCFYSFVISAVCMFFKKKLLCWRKVGIYGTKP